MKKISGLRIGLMLGALMLAGAGCISFGGGGSVSSDPAGIFVSVDKGDGWQQLASLPQADGIKSIANVSVYRIFEDPQDNDAMYLTTRGQGMFYTYDSGRTWQQTTFAPLNQGLIYSVAVHPKDKCLIFATNGIQVFKSIDCSRTWEEVYREGRDGLNITTMAFSYHAPYNIYMAQNNGDFHMSADGGSSWTTLVRLGMSVVRVEPDRYSPGRMYMSTQENGLFRSDDGGYSWHSLASGMEDFSGSMEYRGLIMHPTKQNTMFWLSTYGIMYTTNGGESWRAFELITPPGSVNVFGFGVNPKNDKEIFYTATETDLSRSTFYRSIDGGVNWTTKKLPSDQVPTIMRIHPDESYIYLGFTIPPKQ